MQAEIRRATLITIGGAGLGGFLTYAALVTAPMLWLRMLCVPLFGLTVAVLHLGTSELVADGRLTSVQRLLLTAVLTMATVLFWVVLDRVVGPSR